MPTPLRVQVHEWASTRRIHMCTLMQFEYVGVFALYDSEELMGVANEAGLLPEDVIHDHSHHSHSHEDVHIVRLQKPHE